MDVPSVLARADGVEGRVVVFSSLELAQVLPQDMLHNHVIALTLRNKISKMKSASFSGSSFLKRLVVHAASRYAAGSP